MLPLVEIEKRAPLWTLVKAKEWTSDNLHVPYGSLNNIIAIAYVARHFSMGSYEGWDGFAEMLEADRRTEATAKEKK